MIFIKSKDTDHTYKTRGTPIFIATLICLLTTYVTFTCILASVPPVSRDALTHHLYIPKLYLLSGKIYEIPSIVFSYFPMNLDMLYMLPLALGNDIVPKYIHFSFALLTALIILVYLSSRLNYTYGLLGALFFLSTPIILKLSISVYVDLGLIFFSTVALLGLLQWLRDTKKIRCLIIGALCCGLALGTKYNGLITLFLLTAFIPILYNRAQTESRNNSDYIGLAYAALFVFIALLAYSPWGLRNFIWTNNPFYPLFSSSDTAVMGGMNQFVLRRFLYHEQWWQTLLIPVRIFFEGQDNSPRFFDGQLNPFLLLLPPLAFISLKREDKTVHREKIVLLLFSILFLLFAFFKRELRIRYIGPIIPPLVLLSLFGISNLIQYACRQGKNYSRRIWLVAASCIITAMIFLNFNYLAKQMQTVQPFRFLSGKVSRSQYISYFRPEYPAIEYANQHLTSNTKLLCVFLGNRGYYINHKHTFDLRNGVSTLCSLVQEAEKPEDIVKKLQERQFTHLLMREDLWRRWIDTNLSKRQFSVFEKFIQNNTTILFRKNGYTLYSFSYPVN